MGRNYSRSYNSHSGSRSMSLSNSSRSRSYSYHNRRSKSRSYSRSVPRTDSRSGSKYSRSYSSRSRSSSYRPRRRFTTGGRYDHRPRRTANGRVNRYNMANGNSRNRNALFRRFTRNKYTVNGNKPSGNHTPGKRDAKVEDNKYNSPPFLVSVYSQIGNDFTPEQLANLAQLENNLSYLHVFSGTNLRDLVNLLKGEKPEYRSLKGFWKFYRFYSGQLVDLSTIHSVRLHHKFDNKSFKDLNLSIGEPIFVTIEDRDITKNPGLVEENECLE